MQRLSISAGLLAAGMLMAVPALAQQGGAQAPSGSGNGNSAQQPTKQRTQDATNTYLFKPGSGNYAPRAPSPTKQQTDGEDVTGNNNFPAASK